MSAVDPIVKPDEWRPTAAATESVSLVLDCDTCTVRPVACSDCVVSFLLGPPQARELPSEERHALAVLAGGGLVPPLRLVSPARD